MLVGDFDLATVLWRRRILAAIHVRIVLLAIYPVCLCASVIAAWRMLYLIGKNPDKAWVMAIAHDQLGNAAFSGNPDETLSSRANRARREGRRWGCVLCRCLDWLEPNHCQAADGV